MAITRPSAGAIIFMDNLRLSLATARPIPVKAGIERMLPADQYNPHKY